MQPMKTKPKPTAAFNTPTSTVRQALATRPKTAPNAPKRVKTRTTPSDPLKTGWIEIAKQKPPKKGGLLFGALHHDGSFQTYGDRWSFATHWLALPPPPAPKLNKEKQ